MTAVIRGPIRARNTYLHDYHSGDTPRRYPSALCAWQWESAGGHVLRRPIVPTQLVVTSEQYAPTPSSVLLRPVPRAEHANREPPWSEPTSRPHTSFRTAAQRRGRLSSGGLVTMTREAPCPARACAATGGMSSRTCYECAHGHETIDTILRHDLVCGPRLVDIDRRGLRGERPAGL